MNEQNYECHRCHGREYHCFQYVNEVAEGIIHFGEMCPIMDLRTQLDLKRECKRLGLNSPEECYNRHSKIGKLIPRGSSPLDINSLLERIKYIPVEEIHRAELGLLEDCFIEEEIW